MVNRIRIAFLKERSVCSSSNLDPARVQKIVGFDYESRQAREERKR